MNIDDLTVGQVREISKMCLGNPVAPEDSVWEVGGSYLIRTVTMILTGKLLKVTGKELLLEDAAWIADTGRFNEALKDASKLKEVEPFPGEAIVGRGSIIDACLIQTLPREAK